MEYFFTICYIHDVTQSYTQEMYWRIKLTKYQEKINHRMYMDNIELFDTNEKELEILI